MPFLLTDPAWPRALDRPPGPAEPLGEGLRGRNYRRLAAVGPWGDSLFAKALAAGAAGLRRARHEFSVGQAMVRAEVPVPHPWALWADEDEILLLFEDLGPEAGISHDEFLERPGLLEATARAVAAMHRAGLCHRDLHLDNVLRRPDGSPVLADFAKARWRRRLTRRDRMRDLGRLVGSILPAAHETLCRFAEAYEGTETACSSFCDEVEEAGYRRLRRHHANLDRRARRLVRGAHPRLLRDSRPEVADLADDPDPDERMQRPLLKEGARSRVGRVLLGRGTAILKHYLPTGRPDPRDRLGFSKAVRSLLAAESLLRRSIPAARPLAAWSRPGRGSWLLLEDLPGHAPLDRALLELEPAKRGHLLAETARYLAWMHRCGVACRDLKPSNLLADPQAPPGRRLVLIDHDRNRFRTEAVDRRLAIRDLAALHAGLPPEIRASERLRALLTYDPRLTARPEWRRWVRPLLEEAAARDHRWRPRRLLAGEAGA
ncbi:MAG: hypothetical protein D6702_04875 [Planctomycetota bacterium]|nr:MAG: hypothetical protein D6702_04875 [Planctomycetota bacterium]